MPRRKPPPEPNPPKRRTRGSGSIVVLRSGAIRARLPSPDRRAREFPPGQRAEAEAWLAAMLHPPEIAPAEIVTLGTWVDLWHETYVAPILAPNTALAYRYALQRLEPLYGTPLTDLRASALQAIVAQLAGRLGAGTVQATVGVWRRCLEAAVDDELIPRNPARRLAVPKAPPVAPQRHVTPSEVAAIWPAISGHRFEAALALLLGCGLRIGEVLGVRWADVDLAGCRVWIERQWTPSGWHKPKSRKPRWVHLPERVRVALIRHRNAQPEGNVLVSQSPHVANQGRRKQRRPPEPRPYNASTVRRDLRLICERLGLEDGITPHSGRRGLSSALLDGGAPPAVVADRLGHSSAAVTLRHYAGLSREASAAADEMVERYLGDGTEGAAESPAC